ncbi:MAG: right-handed parallel beta-helix repeat-containing protein [Candidatus Pacebacteria bacterium]|nr:right-handed parallel beta-helix repeat-containing protein [Candidatus Paceibacterota bacterium]
MSILGISGSPTVACLAALLFVQAVPVVADERAAGAEETSSPGIVEAADFGVLGDGSATLADDDFISRNGRLDDPDNPLLPDIRYRPGWDTKDFVGLQSALDYAGKYGKALHIPKGRYILSKPLLFKYDGIRVFGDGMHETLLCQASRADGQNWQDEPMDTAMVKVGMTVWHKADYGTGKRWGNATFRMTIGDCEISHLGFIGRGGPGRWMGQPGNETDNAGILLQGHPDDWAVGNRIHHCFFQGWEEAAVEPECQRRLLVADNECRSCGWQFLGTDASNEDVVIVRNTIVDPGQQASCMAINFEPGDGLTSRRLIVMDNVMTGTHEGFFKLNPVKGSKIEDALVMNNKATCYTSGSIAGHACIRVYSGETGKTPDGREYRASDSVKGLTIVGNTISTGARQHGIAVSQADGILISGNTLDMTGGGYGIWSRKNNRNLGITGNILVNCPTHAVVIGESAKSPGEAPVDVRICHNRIEGSGARLLALYAANGVDIIGNELTGDGKNTGYGILSAWSDGVAGVVQVKGNVIRSVKNYAIYVKGSNQGKAAEVIVRGNVIENTGKAIRVGGNCASAIVEDNVVAAEAGVELSSGEGALLSDFETAKDLSRWTTTQCSVERVQEQATTGKFALRIDFKGSEKDTWPGIRLQLAGKSMVEIDNSVGQKQVTNNRVQSGTSEQDWSNVVALELDASIPEPPGKPLYVQITDGKGKMAIMTAYVGPGKPKTYTYTLQRDKGLDYSAIASVFVYRSKPREDYSIYVDNIRLRMEDAAQSGADAGGASKRPSAREVKLVDTRSLPEIAEEDKARGYLLFHRPYVDMVYQASVPRSRELRTTISCFATRGEYEPVTFSVHALKDLEAAEVVVSDLVGPEGARIGNDSVDVREVRSLNKRITYASSEYIQVPIYLAALDNVDIAAGTSQRFWVTIRAPEDARPGLYRGTIRFSAANAPFADIELVFRVLPFELLEPPGISWGVYFHFMKNLPHDLAAVTAGMEDMRNHGMTSVAPVGWMLEWPLDRVSVENGKITIDFDGGSRIEHLLNEYKRLGYQEPLLVMNSGIVDWAQKQSGQSIEGERFAELYKGIVSAIEAHGRSHAWPELIWQPLDEPSGANVQACARLARLLEEAGAKVEINGWGGVFPAAGGAADAWCVNGGLLSASRIRELHAKEKKLWTYNIDVECYRPELMRFAAGFMMWRAGADGMFNWEYACQYSKSSAFDEVDGRNFFHQYPATEGESGGPATAWEAYREGVDDYKYVYTLEEAIRRARQSGKPALHELASAAEARLGILRNSIPFMMRLRAIPEWQRRATLDDGSQSLEGPMKTPNGWDFEGYDRARWLVARDTMKLMNALDELGEVAEVEESVAVESTLPEKLVHSFRSVPVAETPKGKYWAIRRAYVPRVLEAKCPKIDGQLDDEAWKYASILDGFLLNTIDNAPPTMPTQARIVYDKDNLYLGVTCMETDIEKLKARRQGKGVGSVWADDCIELFMDTNYDRETFFHMPVNSKGATEFLCDFLPEWRPDVQASGKKLADRYQVEIAIPFKDLQVPPNEIGEGVWGFNLGRERHPSPAELSTWSGLKGYFPQPTEFGELSFGGAYIKSIAAKRCAVGQNTAWIQVQNDSLKTGSFSLHMEVTAGNADTAAHSKKFKLAAAESRTVQIPFVVPAMSAIPTLRVWLENSSDKRTIAERELQLPLKQAVSLTMGAPVVYKGVRQAPCEIHADLQATAEDFKTYILSLELWEEEGKSPLRRDSISDLDSRKVQVMLNLAGVVEGEYRLLVTLSTADGRKVGAAQAKLAVVGGYTAGAIGQ